MTVCIIQHSQTRAVPHAAIQAGLCTLVLLIFRGICNGRCVCMAHLCTYTRFEPIFPVRYEHAEPFCDWAVGGLLDWMSASVQFAPDQVG